MKLYIICFLVFFGILAKAKDRSVPNDIVTINVHLKPEEGIRLFYTDDYLAERILSFRNDSKKDTIITKNINSRHITELRYDLMNGFTHKSYFYLFYLTKGDTINIAVEDYDLKNIDKNKMLFVSDYLDINTSVFNTTGFNRSVEESIKINKSVLSKNLRKIDSLVLKKELNDSIAKLWKEITRNSYYHKYTRLNLSDYPLYQDTLAAELKKEFTGQTDINSSYLSSALFHLATYYNLKKDLKSLLTNIIAINTEKRFKIGAAYQALNNYSEKSSPYYLECYALFEKQLGDPVFLKQPYVVNIIPDRKPFDKTTIKLVGTNNTTLTLDDVFKKNKGKILVLDLWASWCVPCIIEFPALEKTKKYFAAKKIAFVGISLDLDTKDKNWKDMIVKSKIGNTNQFRVAQRSNKLVNKLYKIESIPRYLVFDKNGMLINDNFSRPSDSNFETELNRYLSTL